MTKKKIHFAGFLANVDSSVLKVNLDHGFKIEAISEDEGVGLVSVLERLPVMAVGKKLFMDFPCFNFSERKFLFMSNSFETNLEMNENGLLTTLPEGVAKFDNKLVHRYLNTVIRLVRLFKEGNICMPLKYYYIVDQNMPKSFQRHETGRYISREPFTLGSSEIPNLQRFIQDTKIPFEKSFLQLAFENFELSYATQNRNLSFLSLMVSLETLLNPGKHEITYRISRNTAVLLGKDVKDSRKIFREVRELYAKRSAIVHSGKSDIVNNEDLSKLRYYVRESIKRIYRTGKDKNEILNLLNSYGFGAKIMPHDK